MKDHHSAVSDEYHGLYSRRFEHDSCGVGFTARVGGQADHSLVEQALTALVNLEHRGAVGGDKSTGDGSGIMLHLPDDFLRSECSSSGIELPDPGHYGVGMVFLPVDPASADRCRRIIEQKSEEEGAEFLGWRKVPVESRVLGTHARSSEPRIEQCFIGKGSIRPEHLERKLYVIRRLVEKEVDTLSPVPESFYVVTLSCYKIVYKGLMTASQISGYFPDLADPRLISPVAVVHQRYSTNTLPTWKLAQPFRFIAHNGEINTLSGNINRMKTRESILKSELFGEDLDKIKPIIQEDGSDSAIFDNVLELLVLGGRSLPHAMMMMIPEPYGPRMQMSEDKRAFYEFHSAVMEPWDGPAAMVFCDHNYTGGILDRNGLRPARTTTTHSGLIVLSSETGVLNLPPEQILRQGRLRPGQMFLIDHHQDRIIPDREIKARISRQKPYRRWVKDNQIQLRGLFAPASIPHENSEWLYRRQRIFRFTEEEIKMVLIPMATHGQEAINSMGNDTPLAVLSTPYQPLYNYFKQQFAQVTNPPIDPLREDLVMSLESFVGGEGSLLDEAPEQFYGFKLNHPILTPEDLNRIKQARHRQLQLEEINILFDPDHQGDTMENTLERIFQQVEQAIRQGIRLIILSDRNAGPEMAPIPALLAVAGLHHYLIRKGLRNQAGIILESGSVKEVFHYALLMGYGADAICPYLTFATLRYLAENGRLEAGLTAEKAMDHYITAVKKGILKTMSRMGISTLHSFFGSQLFEAIGLSQSLIDRYFRGTVTRIGGLGIREVAREAAEYHQQAVTPNPEHDRFLEIGGQYRYRRNGQKHFWTPESIAKLQSAVRNDSYPQFLEFTRMVDQQIHHHTTLRGLFQLIPGQAVSLDEVEPAESILKRLVTSAMSMGSISPEAHQTIALAQNRLGSRSNSGEGGEDPQRSIPDTNGISRCSKTKQIASGRFGVTPEYLLSAEELQIKMAQGAKPGEGGQLPGHKVSDEIARVRHTTPGVTLISPPPHHDIYSIEDLAQLIHDLRCINPQAEISVKLVSTAGVGTIASGVAKAKADRVLISGYDGGTGASPITSIQHAGIPWELGLAEAHQSLILNRLRDKIMIQVDGQLKTGRDIVIAALLGAEEFGFGTMTLISLGCVMMRKCHLNHCAAGIATQDPQLRSHFQGKPEYIERLIMFLANQVREIMAELGFRRFEDMVGRSDRLQADPDIPFWKARCLDLSPLHQSMGHKPIHHPVNSEQGDMEKTLDIEIMPQVMDAIEQQRPVRLDLSINNTHRSLGAGLSYEITRRYGREGLPDDTLHLELKGAVGQSCGVFLAPGITLHIRGAVNDYLGKGMSGGRIIVQPDPAAGFIPHANVIAGNVALYGATGGELYINGKAGERFAVRNSGAKAVVEGIGDHGCEYMTGGIIVIIGKTGRNFAAGMSGGIAYVYDETQMFDTRCNLDMVDLESVWNPHDSKILYEMLAAHRNYTNSPRADFILSHWESCRPIFVKVIPIDYRKSLERQQILEEMDLETVSATEEVYHG